MGPAARAPPRPDSRLLHGRLKLHLLSHCYSWYSISSFFFLVALIHAHRIVSRL
uniref:Uncharacterized protein n=1 Tax=Arundo donax TaxID=35708 RepID=A0A0A9D6W1_ARUDO